ncbi:MAG: hypothetical protein AB7G11_02185 [Phycisphaerales bacterium]
MKAESSGLVVRQTERHRCEIPVRIVIDPAHAEKVVLTKAARASDGSVAATICDCSLGGLGIRSKVFFPKGCTLTVVCTGEEADAHGFAGEVNARVQRAIMLDREPNYLIGVLHVRDPADSGEQGPPTIVRRIIEYAKRTWPDADSQGGGRA